MTDSQHNEQDQRQLDAALLALAAKEQQHQAPQALRLAIARDVQRAMRAQSANNQPASVLQSLLDWISAHWWRTVSMGSMVAAIPLLTGALLGYQLTSEQQSLDDPAIDWLASYNTSSEPTDQEAAGDLLP
ncbi:MAG: hypothetical protein AB8B93_03670 [Pseudomonadales bacterium]